MKRIMTMAALVLVLVLGSSLRNNVSAQYRDDVSYQTFYDELSPYGQWVDYPEYGYVWVPDAGPDFRPYSTNGHWVWTDDYEWMWVSDYDWGWAPFHYGRWMEDDSYGWVWIPGYEWSPAWVAWRDGGDYYGWAPLRPGINISINFNIGGYSPPNDYWCFAPRRYITYPNVYNYCVPRYNNITIINQTTIINNYNYGGNIWRTGPRRFEAERYCGRITPVRFRDSYNPGRTFFRNNEVSVYRPNVRHDNNRQFAPRQFDRFDGNRNNDTRVGRNEERNPRGNNLPGRDFDRRNNDNRVRENNNGNNNLPGRRFDRTDRNDNNGQPDRNNERRVFRPNERQDRNPNQGNDENRRVFERRNNNADQPDRNNERRVIDRQDRNPNQGNNENRRVFERRNDNSGNNNLPGRQPDVRNNQRQERQQPQRVERQQPQREERQQPQRMERQQPQREERQQPQRVEQQRQEQPRQFERRNDGGNNRQEGNNSGNNGNGRSRRGG
jgi:hypothetical protein